MFHNAGIYTYSDTILLNKIKNKVLNTYGDAVKQRTTFHSYTSNLPEDLRDLIKKIENSEEIRNNICKQYEECDIEHVDSINELYISHYHMDKGGDQGLFDKHYDGVLRIINNATFVRALVYVNSNDNYVVHFLDSNISHNFKTNEYALLDFNREYHQVEGKYDPNQDPNDTRIVLKLNYLVCPQCSGPYKSYLAIINNWIFYLVKKCMEYSKNPKNIFEKFIGFTCNLFRIVNSITPFLALLLFVLYLFLFYLIISSIISYIPTFIKKSKKLIKKNK